MKVNHVINKAQIAQRFSQAHQSYDQHAYVQQLICQNLYQLIDTYLPEKKITNALDIGCGSGQLSRLIKQNFQIKHLFLNDLYPEIKEHFLDIHHAEFLIGDIEKIDLNRSFDLIVSSSALQWVENIDVVFQRISQHLKLDHLFCFSTFGSSNLSEIKQLTGCGLNYLSTSELKKYLEKSGFEILYLADSLEKMSFDHPKLILKHLKATGVTATSGDFRWTKTKLNEFYQAYELLSEDVDEGQNRYPLTYHPIYCVVRRSI